LGLATVGLSCGPSGEAPRLVRLVDLATREAVVESPLLSLAPVVELASRTLWESRFDDEALAELGWSAESDYYDRLSVREDAELGRVVCLRGDRPRRYPVLLKARPLGRYRVTRVGRSELPDLDLRIVESSVGLKVRSEINSAVDRQRLLRGAFLEKGATPAVHRFTASAAPGGWDRSSVDFTTSLDTRTLVLLLDRVDQRASAEACLAEVTIEEIEATPEQELALLARAWTPPQAARATAGAGAEPGLGLVKRGSLLPVRRLRATRPPYDENYEHRDALFAPAPTTLRFRVHVPAGGRLTFSYALARGSQFGDAARFEVAVGERGEWTGVFAEEISIGEEGAGWHWRQAEVGLERWSGRRIELELRTGFARDTASDEGASGRRALALWGNPIVDAPRRPDDPPNVILIGVDTLRADRLSSYGHESLTTPNLDRLAAEGIRFDQAVSASNWTAPSFASIFTGLAASRHGVTNAELAMSDGAVTLAEHLRAGGWRTHAVVYKAFLFGLGLEQGFDRWFNLPTSKRTGQVNLDKALAWLERHHDRRFFLFLHLDDPHQPFNQPPPFDLAFGDAAAHEALELDLPISITRSAVNGCPHCFEGRLPRSEFVPVAQALYDGAVAYTDDRIGALLGRLRAYGIYDDTVIAVVSDHGEVIYDRQGAWGHGALLLTDDLVRVPMILKPANSRPFEPGLVVHEQVRATDLLPTLLEAAGLEAGPGTGAERPVALPEADSRSLWPLIEGAEEGERLAFVENPRRGTVGLRTLDWKYVVRSYPGGSVQHLLYDLGEDPGELINLAGVRLVERARLGDLLAGFLLRTRPGPFVLVLGDGEPGQYRLVLETGEDVGLSSWIGLPPFAATGGPGRDRPVVAGGRVLSLFELDLGPGQVARASLSSGEKTLASRSATQESFVAYADGTLERLAELPAPAIYFLRGAPPLDAGREAATTNLDQLEDLKALGYIE
jgi:arylsulfatase A-like enzyme